MSSFPSPEPDLLRNLLEPILDDLQYWLARSQTLLETETVVFLGPTSQAALLEKVIETQQSVSTARLLLNATDGQAGVETRLLLEWHQLVTQCWQVAMRHRLQPSDPESI
jgi:Protein of unknown function (DUF2605)